MDFCRPNIEIGRNCLESMFKDKLCVLKLKLQEILQTTAKEHMVQLHCIMPIYQKELVIEAFKH